MRLIILLFTILFFACSQTENKTQTNTDLIPEIDSVNKMGEVAVKHKKLSDVDPAIDDFFKNLNAVDEFINLKNGVFCLEPGPGATPVFERLFTKDDLLGKTPFLFLLRDFELTKNEVQINPVDFDPCKDNLEGFFIFDLKQDQNVLVSNYALIKMQDEKSLHDSLLPILTALDKKINKRVDVYFQTKYGEFTSLKFYFFAQEKKMELICLDLMECGA